MNKEIILVGNPNVGKTTLFNTLTNSFEKVSNWHGVTIGVKTKEISSQNEKFSVSDLPGLYSLSYKSAEEKIAVDYLKKKKNELILNVCDANNLERNLILTTELINEGFEVVLILNMINENKSYDINKLSDELGVKVFGVDARKKNSVIKILKLIQNINNIKTQKSSKKLQNTAIISNIKEKLNKCKNINNQNKTSRNDSIDKIILNKFIFIFIFFSLIFLTFYITFGPVGMALSKLISIFFDKIFDNLRKIIYCVNMSDVIKSLFVDGVITGIQSVLSFIPQIILLMLIINILEDVGFMSRVAFMFDGVLKKIGLSGKAFFSLLMGYGCTTSAVLTTRNLENRNLRKRTVFLLPFMSCSAKLPIYLVISSLFFKKYKYIYVFLLYCFSILVSIIVAIVNRKIVPSNDGSLIFEMPKYRLPDLKKVLRDSFALVVEFLAKIGSLILISTIFVWILQNFTFEFKFLNGTNFESSILYRLSKVVLFLFKPLGFDNVGIVVALLLGIVAKEMIVVGLSLVNGVSGLTALSDSLVSVSSVCYFNSINSVVFLVFVLIYSPCVSAIFAVKNELGTKSAIYMFVVQFFLAYLISYFVSKILIDHRYIVAIVIFLILDILLCFMLKSKGKKKCWRNCNACRKI